MLGSGNQIKPWLDVVYRRRYWIIVPGLLGLIGGMVALSQMPKLYHAAAMIFINPDLVSSSFVNTTVTARIEERIATLSVSVKSRSYLEPIARKFKLVGPKSSEGDVAAVCSEMAEGIYTEVDIGKPPKWFKIHVDHANPKLTAGMANSLARAFLESNKSLRESQAATTFEVANEFLKDIQVKLDAKNAELAQYKSAHLLELPEQGQSNFSLMMAAQGKMAAIDGNIRSLTDRITVLQAQAAVLPAGGGMVVGPTPLDPATAHYAQLQRELYDLNLKYRDSHPDVRAKREELEEWTKANPQVLLSGPVPTPDADGNETAPRQGMSMNDVQISLAQKEIARLQEERGRVQGEASTYLGRVTNVPEKQQELQILTRDLDNLQRDYNDWSMKKGAAERSLALEGEHQNAQFEIMDRARVPAVPSKPVPLQVILTGIGVGLALGAAASFIMEFLDNSVRSEEEFQATFPDLPLLASIPDLDRVRKSRRRKATGRKAAALLLCALMLAFLS